MPKSTEQTKNRMKKNSFKLLAKLTTVATIMSSVMSMTPMANAAVFTSSKDTMTRLKISTTADHIVQFTLPATFDFDSTGTVDTLRADFAATFVDGGTWVAGDFTFNDGTSRSITGVTAAASAIDCTATGGVNDVCVAVDTTNFIFTVKPGAGYFASATGAAITFGIFGTTDTGTGTLTNPASAGSAALALAHCDNVASCTTSFTSTHSSSVALGIVDNDQVTVTASVDASITFDIDTATTNIESAAPYSVALGTITTADSRVSGTTDGVNFIFLDLATNASSGAVVTMKNANGALGLRSTSVPGDDILSATGTIANGTELYGVCVSNADVATRVGGGTVATTSPYGSTCASDGQTPSVGLLSSTAVNLLTSTAPMSSWRTQLTVAAAITAVQAAHSDYTDTLTFIATGTF